MKKYFMIVIMLLSILLQISCLSMSDKNIKKDNKQWELFKTVPLREFLGNPQMYKLVSQDNPYKLSLKDMKGKVLWTKTKLERYYDMILMDEPIDIFPDSDDREEGRESLQNDYSDDFVPDIGTIFDKRITLIGEEFVDWRGNCLLTDKRDKSFVIVDKQGTEHYLPINSTDWVFAGTAMDIYMVFCTPWDKGPQQYVIFDMKGTKLKQFNLPKIGEVWEGQIFVDDKADYFAYDYVKTEYVPNTEGYILLSTTGIVMQTGERVASGFLVMEPVFSEDNKLWIPDTSAQDSLIIMDINTRKKVFTLDDPPPSMAAISNRAAGCIMLSGIGSVQVLDYKNKNWIFSLKDENAEFRDTWISGDGKTIRFTFQEIDKTTRELSDKPAEVRYYRMK